MRIKADLHIHTKEDPQDYTRIEYTAKDIIDSAYDKGFGILSITLHNKVLYSKDLFEYAMCKGILLIRGVERTIEGYHVLIYGITEEDSAKLKTFHDLKSLRDKKDVLVIAPHPFYPNLLGHNCLKNKVFENADLFDALEIQQLYTNIYNPNKRAFLAAQKLSKGLVCNSDSHLLSSFGEHYSMVDLPNNFSEKDVFNAIKANKTELIMKPMNVFKAAQFLLKHYFK